MKDRTELPGHEQAAAFWVGALIATQAIAVYVEPDRSGGPFDGSHEFDQLPARLKISILKACEEEFPRRREAVLRDSIKMGDPTVTDLADELSW